MVQKEKDRTTIGVPKQVRAKVTRAAALVGIPVYQWIEAKADEEISKHNAK